MRRLSGFARFASACAAAAIIAAGYLPQGEVSEVPLAEAATIKGGQTQCGAFQLMAGGACTDSGADSCTTQTSGCNGACPYSCPTTATYGGSGTFTGQLQANACGSAMQPVCTQTLCDVSGFPVPCCQCVGGNNVACGPAPFDLDPEGCSNN
jgi:hypothetical protein